MSNGSLPKDWTTWAIIGAAVFLGLLATHHATTAFVGLFFIGFIFILKALSDSGFSSGFLWIVLGILIALLLILGLIYVPAEWRPQQTAEATTQVLTILSPFV
jgi:hypothetical protein